MASKTYCITPQTARQDSPHSNIVRICIGDGPMTATPLGADAPYPDTDNDTHTDAARMIGGAS